MAGVRMRMSECLWYRRCRPETANKFDSERAPGALIGQGGAAMVRAPADRAAPDAGIEPAIGA